MQEHKKRAKNVCIHSCTQMQSLTLVYLKRAICGQLLHRLPSVHIRMYQRHREEWKWGRNSINLAEWQQPSWMILPSPIQLRLIILICHRGNLSFLVISSKLSLCLILLCYFDYVFPSVRSSNFYVLLPYITSHLFPLVACSWPSSPLSSLPVCFSLLFNNQHP